MTIPTNDRRSKELSGVSSFWPWAWTDIPTMECYYRVVDTILNTKTNTLDTALGGQGFTEQWQQWQVAPEISTAGSSPFLISMRKVVADLEILPMRRFEPQRKEHTNMRFPGSPERYTVTKHDATLRGNPLHYIVTYTHLGCGTDFVSFCPIEFQG